MYTLYHHTVSPFSRKVHMMLSEKGLEFETITEKYWQRRRELIAMNPAAQVPVLAINDSTRIADSNAITEYLEESHPSPTLIGGSPLERAEIRRVANWFNGKFYYEVTKYIADEKVMKFLRKQGEPNMEIIRAGQKNIGYHLDYIGFLTQKQTWLAGDSVTLADISAAAHISLLDYLHEVPWHRHAGAKNWYALMKSRPSMRRVLEDRIGTFQPPKHYTNPDF